MYIIIEWEKHFYEFKFSSSLKKGQHLLCWHVTAYRMNSLQNNLGVDVSFTISSFISISIWPVLNKTAASDIITSQLPSAAKPRFKSRPDWYLLRVFSLSLSLPPFSLSTRAQKLKHLRTFLIKCTCLLSLSLSLSCVRSFTTLATDSRNLLQPVANWCDKYSRGQCIPLVTWQEKIFYQKGFDWQERGRPSVNAYLLWQCWSEQQDSSCNDCSDWKWW